MQKTQVIHRSKGSSLEGGIQSTQNRGAAMSRNETAPDTHRLSTDKPQMCPVAVDAGNPLERSEQDAGRQAVTTQGRSGSTSRHQQEGSHGHARVSSRHSDSQQGHRATPTERDSVHAEGAAMSRNETAPDTHRLSTDKPQMCSVAIHAGNPLERSEQDGGRQAVTTQGRSGSTSRHQQEGSHGQARVSSRHSDSQQGHRASPRERDSVHAEGAAMSRNETAPDTHGLSTDKPQCVPVAVDAGNPLRALHKMRETSCDHPGRSGSTSRHQRRDPMARRESALGTSTLSKGTGHPYREGSVHAEGAAMSRTRQLQTLTTEHGQTSMCPVPPQRQRALQQDGGEQAVTTQGRSGPPQGTSRRDPMARRESALGTQTLSKGTGHPYREGLCPRRGAAMSRNETAPDTHGLSTDKPQMCPVAVGAGNPLAPSKMEGDSCDHQGRSGSTSRHQQEGSHGQARVSSRHSDSQQGTGPPLERGLSALPTDRGAAMTGTRQLRHSRLSTDKPQMCPVPPASDSERSEQDAGQTVTTQGRSGSTSRHTSRRIPGQARVSSRHSDSQQGHRATPTERDLCPRRVRSSAAHRQGAAMSRNETAPDTHETEHGQTSDVESAVSPASDSERSEQDGGRHAVTTQGRSGGIPWPRRESALGTQTLSKGTGPPLQRGTLSTQSPKQRCPQTGRRHEQERDSSRHSRLSTDKPQMCPVAVDSRESARSEQDGGRQAVTTQGRSGSTSRHQQEGSHGQARVSSRHSALSKGTGHPYREGLCPRRVRKQRCPQQGRRHEQERDSSRHSRTEHGQTSCVRPPATASASEQDEGDKLHQQEGSHGQARVSSRHSDSQQGHRATPKRGTLSTQSPEQRCPRQGRRHEQEQTAPDTHRLSTDKPQMCPVAVDAGIRSLRARWRETSCDHPGKIWVHLKAPAGGIPWPGATRATGPPLQRGTLSTQNRGAAMSRNETAPDTHAEHGQPSVCPVAVDAGNPLERSEQDGGRQAVTTQGILGPPQGTSRRDPMASATRAQGHPYREGLLALPTDRGRRHEQERDSSRHSRTEHGQTSDVFGSRTRRESARALRARWRETSCDHPGKIWVHLKAPAGGIPWPGASSALGPQTLSKGHRATPTERDSVHAEGAAMSRNETLQHSRTEHGQTQMCPPASDSERSEQDGGRQAVTTQGRSGSTSRHQQEGSHGQARVSSRHSDSQQGHRATLYREGLCPRRVRKPLPTDRGAAIAGTRQLQHSGLSTDKPQMCSGSRRRRESARALRARWRETSCDHPGKIWVHLRHQQRDPMAGRESALGTQTLSKGTGPPLQEGLCPAEQGRRHSRNETAPDTHRLSTDKPQSVRYPTRRESTREGDNCDHPGKIWVHLKAPAGGSHGQALNSHKGNRAPLERGLCPRRTGAPAIAERDTPDTHGLSTDNLRCVRPASDSERSEQDEGDNCDHPEKIWSTSSTQQEGSHGQRESPLGTQTLSKGHRAPLQRGTLSTQNRGAAMSRNETLQTSRTEHGQNLRCFGSRTRRESSRASEQDVGRQAVTTQEDLGPPQAPAGGSMARRASHSRHSDSQQGHRATIPYREGLCPRRSGSSAAHRQGAAMSRNENAPDTHNEHGQTSDVSVSRRRRESVCQPASDSERSEQDGGRQAVTPPREDLGPPQGTSRGIHGQARVSSRHSDSQQGHRATPTERTLSAAHRQGRRHEQNETAPDTHGLSTDKPQMCPVAVAPGNPLQPRQRSERSDKMQGDKLHHRRDPMARRRVSLRPQTLSKGTGPPTERDSVHAEQGRRHEQERDSSRHSRTEHGQTSMESAVSPPATRALRARCRETSCDHPGKIWVHLKAPAGDPMARRESALGTQTLSKGTGPPLERGTLSAAHRQGRRHEQERDSSSTHGLSTDNPQMCPVAVRREPLAPSKMQGDKRDHPGREIWVHLKAQQEGSHGQRESALGTQTLSKGTGHPYERDSVHAERGGPAMSRTRRSRHSLRTGTDKPQESAVPGQRQRALRARWRETSCDHPGKIWQRDPNARRESALGTQTLSKGTGPPLQRGTLSTQNRGAAMSRNETAPDTHGLSTDKPQMCPVAVGAGNPLSPGQRQRALRSKMKGDRCDHPGKILGPPQAPAGGSHGHARVSSRPLRLSARAQGPPREGLCSTQIQGCRHDRNRQLQDTHGLSNGQTSDVPWPSAIDVHFSDSER
ncbi:hypothetical protein Cadr_000024795 [Camelus dromedarius]|uniref:Uncharacterized protein n=1 Tax=Camelus dromedarius TaxID=9838 RepID=A0A5N4CPT6_CAMDR|nr:hypothetical protein Cadr_000024795 [Camelus dromedarius]